MVQPRPLLTFILSTFVISLDVFAQLELPDLGNNDNYQCRAGQFKCKNKNCVWNKERCNGVNDCKDLNAGELGTDELNCKLYNCDGPNLPKDKEFFMCKNSVCLDKSLKCNGINNCFDLDNGKYGSDEDGCKKEKCKKGFFRCKDGFCVRPQWRCDGKNDCHDMAKDMFGWRLGSDETNCNCTKKQFRCLNGKCIKKSHVCNKINDCFDLAAHTDGSDEVNCEYRKPTKSPEAEARAFFGPLTGYAVAGAVAIILIVLILVLLCRYCCDKRLDRIRELPCRANNYFNGTAEPETGTNQVTIQVQPKKEVHFKSPPISTRSYNSTKSCSSGSSRSTDVESISS